MKHITLDQKHFKPLACALLMVGSLVNQAHATEEPSNTELTNRVDQLSQALADVQAQLAKQQSNNTSPTDKPISDTVLSSYGEINLNVPKSSKNTQADLRRFVLGIQHRFDDKTKMVGEIEWEHAVVSADDAGETAIEQAYIEHEFNPTWSAQAGVFLIPIGLLNENHEPTAYYGVERNMVETAIIPTTWREGGVKIIGQLPQDITLKMGISTGFDINKWDATTTEGSESPLATIHQEMQLARAKDPSIFAALNWQGVAGLTLGGGLFTGGVSQGQTVSSRLTLWDIHARWQPAKWDISALYSKGNLSNTDSTNNAIIGQNTLIPATFDGGYIQTAYRLWSKGDMTLLPFLRLERYNTAKSYANLGEGFTPEALPYQRITTLGLNWNINTGVVVKADIQRTAGNSDADRFNLGIGWSF